MSTYTNSGLHKSSLNLAATNVAVLAQMTMTDLDLDEFTKCMPSLSELFVFTLTTFSKLLHVTVFCVAQ